MSTPPPTSSFVGNTPLSEWLRIAATTVPRTQAIIGPDATLTYSDLQAEVLRWAAQIRAAGLVPGERVGLAANRNVQSVVCLLACVEAGVAYVPLDLSYPPERLRAMLQDAKPRAVLGDSAALALLTQAVGTVPTLAQPTPPQLTPSQPDIYGAAKDLTYVLFTSGSTGRPKGVAMGAQPLQSLIAWHAAHARLGQAARTLQFAPLSFDVHFQEIFSTIACLGTLVVLPEAQRRDPGLLHAALVEHGVQRIFVPYVALQMIAQASHGVAPPQLRDVISAGEQLQITPAIRSLFARLQGAELHNHYGPTESHVVSAHALTGDPALWPDIPPIGLPLPHALFALREPGQLAPATGDTGELLLGGNTLAHGYLGRADLSAERFVDSVGALEGRWYLTGDLVRRDAQGSYTYLGRADQQMKVDGFRIEPAEIELVLLQDARVKEAVVTAPDIVGVGKQLVAYVVLTDDGGDSAKVIASLRSFLRQKLPEYMVPVRYEILQRLPTTPSGKIDRRGLPVPVLLSAALPADSAAQALRALWQDLLGVAQIGDDQNLFELGARSLLVLRFIARWKELGLGQLQVADVYDRPTLGGLLAVAQGAPLLSPKARRVEPSTDGIAIVGMATRTAGADGVEAFWRNLLNEQEGIRHYSASELDPTVAESVRQRSNFVAARGALEDVARFDAALFGISPREATVMDPQQRLMLELSWAALEHAAIDPAQTPERIGVYAGTGNNNYAPLLRQQDPELVAQYGEFATMLASEKDYCATRVANRLNLKGPALSIHTACSTGLVAVAQAWHALASGQCDVALAGGVSVLVPQESGYLHVQGGMESADGHCRPFDANASGTVFASGGGVVVLKRLQDALQDGSTIYGVIRGVGVNNDGADKASFTAPSVSGQAGAIRMALDHAQLNARSIGYVEAHGTGTVLGDPIEVAALTRAWLEDTTDTQYCGLGSVKSNLGHMVAAAGVVGLVKATLALHHQVIPATLHFQRPNPEIDFAHTPFHVVSKATPWTRGDTPRYAAVSSFGVGGTNAHVIVQEAPVVGASSSTASTPETEPQTDSKRLWVLPISGGTATAALQRADDLATYLDAQPHTDMAALASTLVRGRKPLAHRAAVVARSPAEAALALRSLKSAGPSLRQPRVVWMFAGQGSQHPGMAKGLAQELPAFGVALQECLALVEPMLGVELGAWLLHAQPDDVAVAQQLAQTQHAQPALFCMSYALAAWLQSVGVKPGAMIGHSIGEYTAACLAGVFSLKDALHAVVARGRAMAAQPTGAMLAVRSDAATVAAALAQSVEQGVEIAGLNAPNLTVVAGELSAVESFAATMAAGGVESTRLKVSHAFHSASMEGALPHISAALGQVALGVPTQPLYSCVSGQLLQAHEATDPHYWARQARAPVRFSQAVQAELALGEDVVFVEVGPGQALTALVRQHRTAAGVVPRVVPLLGTATGTVQAARNALAGLGALWCAGVKVAWPVQAGAAKLALPTYPFGGQRYWFKPASPMVVKGPEVPNFGDAFLTQAVTLAATLQPHQVLAPTMKRLPRLEQEVARILSDVSGLPQEGIATDATLVDQGFDSLSLTQATLELGRVFGLKLRFRRLLEDLNTVAKLSQFLDTELPADQFAAAPALAVAPGASASFAMPAGVSSDNLVQQMILQQMQLMQQQLAALQGQGTPSAVQPDKRSLIEKPFGAAARITLEKSQDFTPAQQRWLDDFIQRYNAKTGKSKAFSQKNRKTMADPRVVTGFNPLWKDLVYPIVVEKSLGANLWDLDGNQYIDLLSCFGGNLLGYQPDGLVTAMVQQLKAGIEVGPQHPLSAEVADLICEFTGMQRVGFCNTGSEAVMGAMRIARTVTGRKTIAIFANSYHGIFDEVIVRGTKQLKSLSAAPGILANTVENILVLDWNSEESLRVLQERGPELAAIMTEPIQNKYPTIQPREFVHALRRIATDAGCALIFDEVVTGFRVAPGGAQEFYGVRADICTYGKIIGGGLPFAAIAGAAVWLDALDGGHWQYGDDSYPQAGVTYFAGTFVRHPLALAAAKASLLHLKRRGPNLYREINERTQRMVQRLNAMFVARRAPVQAVHCASLWRLAWDDGQKYVGFFYYLLRFHGLHVYEQFGHFVTEAIGESQTQRIVDVFTQCLDELLAVGLIVPRSGSGPNDGGGTGGQPSPASALHALPSTGPLTPGQTERWLAGAFDPGARRALNESLCISLAGAVDMPALRQALQDVLGRHAAFRVSFDAHEPLQTLAHSEPMQVAEVDLRAQADCAAALDQFCIQASERDFPFNQAPLAAASVLRLSDGRAVVHLVASHLVFDGWASSVFNSELALAYKARAAGKVPQFAPAESPLVFAQHEQLRMQGEQGQESLAYWKSVLNNPPAQLQLGDLTPPAARRYVADTVRGCVDGDAWGALRGAARMAGCTLFQFLLTALTAVLQRRSQQSEFVISIPYASQGLGRHGPLMADGVLDLPLRLGCNPQETGLAVAQRVRSHLMDALDHPVATQGAIARAMGLRSAGDKPPLTSIFFNLNPKVDLVDFSPLVATMHEGRKRGTLSELFFNFYEKENSLSLDLHYSTEAYSGHCAQALVDDLLAVCAALARDPHAALAHIGLPSDKPKPKSKHQVDPRLVLWNATDCPLDSTSRVEQWVARQASTHPDAPAITCGANTLTYRQLEARANQFGNVLQGLGLGPGALVGLCLGRGPDLLAALLGVLKCGAAYVPLDPGFPPDRLRYMAQDAELALVITESPYAELAGLPREKQLRVDDDAQRIAQASPSPLVAHPQWQPDAVAYVIYTSGSTGQPKGVVLGQQAVCNFLASMRRKPGLNANDKLLAVTTLSFDIAVLELLLPLTVGAQVVLAQREEAMDGEALARMVQSHGITVMQATPTTWHVLLDAGWRAPQRFRALCGGEPLPPSLAARLLEQGIELWNMYGPTETTVWSTVSRVQNPATHATPIFISIGTPIDNTQVWVLDEALQPVPVGSEGEICIGGLGVAHGYFKRPELTVDRFVPDPFGRAAGARLYRTGDLGRWNEDGTLQHLGRLDYQIKIRGYRIELGEIEARLAAQPSVARAVALAREDTPGDVRLVAYAVAQLGHTLDVAALRESLRLGLPDYMVPQHVVALDAMPLLPNGKIDRKALPAPVLAASGAVMASEPPGSELERTVANAMQAVLKISGVGARDDFFALGGHSLLAARLVAQLNRELGLQLGLKVLFESPTVQQLARAIGLLQGVVQPQRAPIVHRDSQSAAPLTLMQERMHFVERMLGGGVAYNAPSCHRLTGPMNLEAFERAFQEMVRRQPALRTRFVRTADGAYLQEVSSELATHLLPLSDLSGLAHAQREAALAVELDALASEIFDLEHGPLFKARLFKLAPHEHALYFCCHHIVWDGWSFDILYAEMSALYGAYSHGASPALVELPLTYGDFSQWHQQWLQTEEIQGQLGFWMRQFATAPAVRVPVPDLPRLKSGVGRGASEFMFIPNAQVEQLRDVARRTSSTLSIVALSVYAAVVSQWLDEPTPAIGLPVRGRPSPELESVMGFFNNMLPLRLRVEPAHSALDLIAQVRSTVTLAFANQDVPFELLAQRTPGLLYQAMFSFQDARARQTHWGPLAHERIPVMHKGAAEDVNLWMVEIPDGIEAGVQYNADVFLPSTARALGERFVLALQRLVQRPGQSVGDLLRPSGAEQLRLNALGQSQVNAAPSHGLLQWVDEYCAQNPHAVAWRQKEQSFSRIQLQQAVQQVQALLAPHIHGGRDVVVLVGHTAAVQGLAGLAALACGARVLCLQAPLSLVGVAALAARTDVAAVLAAPFGDLAWPVPVAQVDISATVSSLGLKNLAPRADVSPATRPQPTIALDLPTLAALLANSRALAPLAAGDVVLAVEGEDMGRLLAWTLITWASGAVWKTVDAQELSASSSLSTVVHRAQPRHIHAPWKDLRDLMVVVSSDSAPLLAWGDAATLPAHLPAELRSRGVQVVVGLYLDGMDLPVAAQLVDDMAFNGICGRPLLPGKLSVLDAQGQPVPLGVAGQLRWELGRELGNELGNEVAIATDFSYRWRSDGVLQRMFNMAPDSLGQRDGEFAREAKVAPRSDAEAALCEIWSELLARTDIGVTDDFFRLGGHSMLAMRMMVLIHQRMGRQLPVSALLMAPTIRLLATRLTSQALSDSLVLIRPGDHTKPVLFLVHDGDGETLLYRNLAMRLAPGRAVYGLQPLAGKGLAMQHTRIRDMAKHFVATIRRVQPHGPYMVGGLCAGGVIAFEVACQLQALGEPVAMTAVLDIGDVHAPVRRALVARERMKRFARIFRNADGAPLAAHLKRIASLVAHKAKNYLSYTRSTRAIEAVVNSQAQRLQTHLDRNETPADELTSLTVRQLYCFARDSYTPESMLHADLVLFRAKRGDGSQADTPGIEMYADAQFGWPTRISGALRGFDVPGGHSTMLQEPHVDVLATLMQAEIDRVEAPTTLSAQLRIQGQYPEREVAATATEAPQRASERT